MAKVYFHGDVVFEQIDQLPGGLKKKKDNKIAEGELTGHAHSINNLLLEKEIANIFEDEYKNVYVENKENIEIDHPQHNSFFINIQTGEKETLPSGYWKVSFPTEYNHFTEEAKRVVD